MALINYTRELSLRWGNAAIEATICIGQGLRDAASVRLLALSAMLCVVPMLAWGWVYYQYNELIGATLLVLGMVGAYGLLLGGFQGFIVLPSGGNSASASALGGVGSLLSGAQALILVAAILAALYVLVYLFLVICTARAATPSLLLPSATRRVLGRLGPMPAAQVIPMAGASSPWRTTLLLLALCCIPAVAGFLLVAGLCYLNVRLIYGGIARSTGPGTDLAASLQWRWRPLLLIGAFLLLLVAVPVLNLTVPVLMCTAVARLAFRNNLPRLSS